MLRQRNVALHNRPLHQKLTKSDDSYFGLMRRIANKENVQYRLTPLAVQNHHFIQYLPSTKNVEEDSSKVLCRRLHMC